MVGFALVLALADWFPGFDLGVMVLRLVVPLGLFAYFAARGCYPELRRFRPAGPFLALDVLLGLAVTAAWVAPAPSASSFWFGARFSVFKSLSHRRIPGRLGP